MINERLLRINEVRLLGPDGHQFGVLTTSEALDKAKQMDLDLVLVAPHAEPPVCKIVDYGKHKYEQSKAKKDHKKKVQEVKGVKLRPGTDKHDIEVLVKKAIKFLGEGDKVRVTCAFRYRELAHPEIGRDKIAAIVKQLEDYGKADKEPVLSGREMVVVINPVSGKRKNVKTQDKEDGGQAV